MKSQVIIKKIIAFLPQVFAPTKMDASYGIAYLIFFASTIIPKERHGGE
jgi:hypothetical protein